MTSDSGYRTSTRARVSSRPLCLLFALALVVAAGAGCTKQARANRSLARADRDFQAEKYDQAEIEYMNVLRNPRLNAAAVRQLGLLYYAEGRIPRAFQFLQEAARRDPANPEVRLKLGEIYLAFRMAKEAREAAALVLQKQPENGEALLLLAEAATTNQVREVAQRVAQLPAAIRGRANSHLALGALAARQQDLPRAEAEFKAAVAADPKSSDGYTALGNLYLARNDRAQAEPALKRSAELAPLRSGQRLRYAEFELASGAPEAGKRLLEEITRKAPDYVPAWVLLAQFAYAKAKTDECAGLLDQALSRDPLNREALLMRGNLALAKGDGTNAITQFDRLARAYDKDPEAQYRLALAHLLNKEPSKADASLNRALTLNSNFVEAILLRAELNVRQGNSGPAVSSLTRLLKQQPRIPNAYPLLANAYLAQNHPDDAIEVYRQMTQAFPKEPQAPLLLGELLARQGRTNDARQAFEKALELAPASGPALEQIVDLDLAEKQYPRATARVQQRIDKDARAAGPWLLMAEIHLRQAMDLVAKELQKRAAAPGTTLRFADVPATRPDVDRAEKALLKALELNPNLHSAYLMLARLYVSCNKQQQALDRLDNLAKTNDVSALMEMALIHTELKDFPAARDAYEKILAFNPNFVPALNNLAYLYSEPLRQPDKAYALAEKARQFQPNDPSIADTLGWILFQRGEYARALALAEEAAPKLPADPGVTYHLGMAHYMMGEEDPARVALQAAVQAAKDFPGKEDAGRRLATLALDVKMADASQVAELRKRLSESPNDPIAAGRLAAILERDGAFDQAAQIDEATLKSNPQNLSAASRLARLYANHLHNPAKALAWAKAAHNLAPEDAHISHLLGRLVYQTGDYKYAASLLEDSARKLADDPDVWYDLAWSDYSLGRVGEAQAAMQKAAQATPPLAHAAEAKRFLAMIAAADPTQTPETLAEVQKVLKTDPDCVPALMALAVATDHQANYQEAARLYGRVLARFPAFAPAAKNLARLYCDNLGDDRKAYSLASKARESFPDDPELARLCAILAYRQGNLSLALPMLQDCLRNRPNDAELLYCLGMTQSRLKQPKASREALKRAIDLGLPPKLTQEANNTLRALK